MRILLLSVLGFDKPCQGRAESTALQPAHSPFYCAKLWSTQIIFILEQVTSGAFFMDPLPLAFSLNATFDSVNCHTCSTQDSRESGRSDQEAPAGSKVS
jgi:hypothetical protein